MKNLLIVLISLLFLGSTSAQVKFGVRGGLSSTDLKPGSFLITNQATAEAFTLSTREADYGYHLGVFLQAGGKKFFIQPEILFNSSSVSYNLESGGAGDLVSNVFNETYHNIDIPFMLGFKMGPLRLQGGPVGHVHINSSSELTDFQGYEEKFETFTYGYQAGLGLDFWKFVLDLKYEGNFSNFGDHFNFFGTQYNFDNRPGRIVASVGIAF